MAATIVGQVGGDNGGGSTTSIVRPSTAAVGDILLAIVEAWPETVSVSEPASQGWTPVSAKVDNANPGAGFGATMRAFTRVDNGAAGPWTFATPGATWRVGQTVAIRGGDTAAPIDNFSFDVSDFSWTTGWWLPVDTVEDGELVIAVDGLLTSRVVTWGGGFGDVVPDLLPMGYKVQPTAGPVTPANSYNDFAHTISFAFAVASNPAAPPPPTSSPGGVSMSRGIGLTGNILYLGHFND